MHLTHINCYRIKFSSVTDFKMFLLIVFYICKSEIYLLSLVSDKTGLSEAAVQSPAGRVSDKPHQSSCFVHYGVWTLGTPAATRSNSHHPGSTDKSHTLQTCPRTSEGYTHSHYLLPLLTTSELQLQELQ